MVTQDGAPEPKEHVAEYPQDEESVTVIVYVPFVV